MCTSNLSRLQRFWGEMTEDFVAHVNAGEIEIGWEQTPARGQLSVAPRADGEPKTLYVPADTLEAFPPAELVVAGQPMTAWRKWLGKEPEVVEDWPGSCEEKEEEESNDSKSSGSSSFLKPPEEEEEEEEIVAEEPRGTAVQVAADSPALDMTPLPPGASLAQHGQEYAIVPVPAEAPMEEAVGAADAEEESNKEVLESFENTEMTVQLLKSATNVFATKDPTQNVQTTKFLETRGSTAHVLWAIRCVISEQVQQTCRGETDAQTMLEAFVVKEGFGDRPFLLTIRGAVPEMIVMIRKTAADKKKDVTFSDVDSQAAFGFRRGGTAATKIMDTVEGFIKDARHVLTNLELRYEKKEAKINNEIHGYADLEAAVAHWGMKRFTHFIGDVEIKKANRVPLGQFEKDCLAVHTRLATWVRHREEVSDDVFFMESARMQKQCPGSYDEDATAYAKSLRFVRWSRKQQQVIVTTLDEWLNGPEHERSSLLMFGEAEVGKSKLAHLCAQELCIGKGADRYVFTKAIDGLGILCYAGDLRQSGCICIMDCKFQASRGKTLKEEDFKSLWDVEEGGTIKDTRYKPANLPSGVPRIMGLNGSPGDLGRWFREHEQYNMGAWLDALPAKSGETTSAYKARLTVLANSFSADEQAMCRRVSIGIPTSSLITSDFIRRLEQDAVSTVSEQAQRRKAYWARKNASL